MYQASLHHISGKQQRQHWLPELVMAMPEVQKTMKPVYDGFSRWYMRAQWISMMACVCAVDPNDGG